MEALLMTLIGWINMHTEYETVVDLPNIVVTEPANLCQNYGLSDPGACQATRLMGFYDQGLTIYLHPDFDSRNPADQSRLMHELVHYIQWHNDQQESTCWAHLELEAYNLQDEWRSLHEVAQFTDTFYEVNGVAKSFYALLRTGLHKDRAFVLPLK